MYAYAHATLEDEAIKLIQFSSSDKILTFIEIFFGNRGL